MIKILNSSFVRLGVIKNVTEATRLEVINGENILDFVAVLDSKLNSFINEDTIFELNDDYFDIATFKKSLNEDNTFTIEVESEHISYRLNRPEYNVEYFTGEGTPIDTLGVILAGTGFAIGDVEFSTVVTYSAQEAMSRRQVLMEYAAYIEAEVEFNKFVISFRVHIGSTLITSVIKDRNVKVISKSIDKRTLNSFGQPTITYICTPVHIPLDDYVLGDNILLVQTDLGIHETLRVVSISRNPYDDMDTTFNFSNYINGLADSLYRIITDGVSKDKFYNGTRIGPEFGFEAIRNDKMARAYLRSDGLALQSGDGSGTSWTDRLYYEYDSVNDETVLVFDGKFTASVIEALSAIITPNLFADKGYISELTVDRLETSDKVQRYLNNDISDVNFIRIEDQVLQFITATVAGGFEQAEGRNGELLYWLDDTYTASSAQETSFPVNLYLYTEVVKMENTFEYDSELEEYVPRISLGLNPEGTNGTGAIYKGKTGLHIDYNSNDGDLRQILMNDAGIILTPLVQFMEIDRLVTGNKIQKYLDLDTSDVNYISIVDQVLQFITATIDLAAIPNFEQYVNRTGNPLYWFDETHVNLTTDETDFPVYVYKYIDTVKMENTFEYDSELEEYVPRISLGLSEDPSSNGTGAIYKGKTGLHIDYTSTTGNLRQILMNDAGIILTPLAAIGTMELTADRLDTQTKIQRYLDSDTSDVNYISIVDQVLQFITATIGTGYEQFINRDGAPLYWFDATHIGITTDETPYPVNIYIYTELVKMENSFEYDAELEVYIPRIVLGAGTGDGDNEKGFISKGPDGLNIDYYNSVGDLRQILLNEDGIEFIPETGNTNIAATTIEVQTVSLGEFISEEWTHGFDTSVDNVHFLVTAQYYDENIVRITDIRVEQLTPTTCRIIGLSSTPIT